MSHQIETGIEGRLGVIALNRPGAINALTHDMVLAITATLKRWRDQADVLAVLFEGRGERGFCAGGDVRAIRTALLEGKREAAEAFFADEYAMNLAIATFPKPVIALVHGAVMGGGIGIAGHAGFRFAAATARFAMPEAAIGFVCDVGVNAILEKAPLNRALLFELSGLSVGAGDAMALGLADCVIAPERMGAVRQGLLTAATAPKIETAIVTLMQAEAIEPGEAELCALADRLAAELSLGSASQIVAAIAARASKEPQFAPVVEALRRRSPTSLTAIHASHIAARKRPAIGEVLAADLRLARLMIEGSDFIEGVRAVLVDKGQEARWNPADFEGVATEAITAAIAQEAVAVSNS